MLIVNLQNSTVAGHSPDHSREQIVASGTNNEFQVSSQPVIPSHNPESSKQPTACSNQIKNFISFRISKASIN